MAGFSSSQAAFCGFRLIGQRPRAVLAWAGALLLLSAFTWVVLYMLAWTPFLQFQLLLQSADLPDPQATAQLMRDMAPAWAVIALLAVVVQSAVFAAVLRAFLDPERYRLGGLRFGADELRLIGAGLLLALLAVGLAIAIVVIGAVLTLGLGFIVREGLHAPITIVKPTITLWILAWVIVFQVRLSLTFVATFAEQRIGIARSWRLTRGRFWPLLGAYVLMLIFVGLVYLAALALYVAALAAVVLVTHGALSDVWALVRFPLLHMSPAVFPVWLLGQVVALWIGAGMAAVVAGPSVEAYRAFSKAEARPRPTVL